MAHRRPIAATIFNFEELGFVALHNFNTQVTRINKKKIKENFRVTRTNKKKIKEKFI